jgi:streptomycin 6-kinase
VVQVPEVVRQKALAVGAGVWLDDLPLLVASLEQEWGIAVGDAYGDSTEAFVAEATYEDGTPAVLKLLVPRGVDAAQNEITVLRLNGGEGCARLLREDATRGALLLERPGHSLYQLALPIHRRYEILCSTATRVWRLAPGCGRRMRGTDGSHSSSAPFLVRAITGVTQITALSHRVRARSLHPHLLRRSRRGDFDSVEHAVLRRSAAV